MEIYLSVYGRAVRYSRRYVSKQWIAVFAFKEPEGRWGIFFFCLDISAGDLA